VTDEQINEALKKA